MSTVRDGLLLAVEDMLVRAERDVLRDTDALDVLDSGSEEEESPAELKKLLESKDRELKAVVQELQQVKQQVQSLQPASSDMSIDALRLRVAELERQQMSANAERRKAVSEGVWALRYR